MTVHQNLVALRDFINTVEAEPDERELDIYVQPGTPAAVVSTSEKVLGIMQAGLTPKTIQFELATVSVKLGLGKGVNLLVPLSEIPDIIELLTGHMRGYLLVDSSPEAKQRYQEAFEDAAGK